MIGNEVCGLQELVLKDTNLTESFVMMVREKFHCESVPDYSCSKTQISIRNVCCSQSNRRTLLHQLWAKVLWQFTFQPARSVSKLLRQSSLNLEKF